ncbi:MAG TPA: DoxX family protein [Pirellulales bacterium]|nr:DoxX family protein [Pirellulales bacterium]
MDLALLIVRVVVGVIFAAHGAQKLFGAFEGPGLEATVTSMGQMLPKGVVYAVIIGEFFGGCGLVLGFLSRFSAASLILIMAGAIQMVHGPNGFFLQNRGFEYNVALIGLLLPILIAGPGAFSLGRFLMPKSSSTGRPIVVLE